MKVISKKVPNLFVRDLNVRFVKGAAKVDDKKKIEALKKMKGYEFEFESDDTTSTKVPKPQGTNDAKA